MCRENRTRKPNQGHKEYPKGQSGSNRRISRLRVRILPFHPVACPYSTNDASRPFSLQLLRGTTLSVLKQRYEQSGSGGGASYTCNNSSFDLTFRPADEVAAIQAGMVRTERVSNLT